MMATFHFQKELDASTSMHFDDEPEECQKVKSGRK